MKGLLGLGLAVFAFLTSAHGQVAVYRQHLVVNQSFPGFRSRTIQDGWMLVDQTTTQIATVVVDKRARRFFVEFSTSSRFLEQTRNNTSTITILQQGSLSGLRTKGINRVFDFTPGASLVAPKVLHVTGSSSSVKFFGNLVLDESASRNFLGVTPTEGLENIRAVLLWNGYTEEN